MKKFTPDDINTLCNRHLGVCQETCVAFESLPPNIFFIQKDNEILLPILDGSQYRLEDAIHTLLSVEDNDNYFKAYIFNHVYEILTGLSLWPADLQVIIEETQKNDEKSSNEGI